MARPEADYQPPSSATAGASRRRVSRRFLFLAGLSAVLVVARHGTSLGFDHLGLVVSDVLLLLLLWGGALLLGRHRQRKAASETDRKVLLRLGRAVGQVSAGASGFHLGWLVALGLWVVFHLLLPPAEDYVSLTTGAGGNRRNCAGVLV